MQPLALDFTAMMPEDALAWNSVHPSQLSCARKIYLHLKAPSKGDASLMSPLKPRMVAGIALHKSIVPSVAEMYRSQGWTVYEEVSVQGTIEGLEVHGYADLVVTKENEAAVIDLKFVLPRAVRAGGFAHHFKQVAVYCHLLDIPHAFLYYIATDLLSSSIITLEANALAKHFEDARALLRQVADAIETGEPPITLNANDYPCRWRTFQGEALCPFYRFCHGEPLIAEQRLDDEVYDLVARYLQVRRACEEAEQNIQPLIAEKEDLERVLKVALVPAKIYETGMGKLRLIKEERHYVDTKAVKEIAKSLGLSLPERISVAYKFEVNYDE